MKIMIDEFLDKKEDFDKLSFTEQTKYLAYFYIKITKDPIFISRNINDLFNLAQINKPSNTSDLFNQLVKRKIFIKTKQGYMFHRTEFKNLENEFLKCSKEGNNFFYISGKEPWTDRNKKFLEFLNKLEGEILILDSYYGIGTFHILENFGKTKKVKFLTANLGSNENQEKVTKELSRFKREFSNIGLRKYPKFYELHDRYILSDNLLVWIGHGIKDFGDKECFLIGVPTKEVPEIAKILRIKFNERWNKSDNLT